MLIKDPPNGVPSLRILHTESSEGLGGQEYRTLHECLGMKARGHQVYLAVQPDSQLRHKAQDAGVAVLTVAMKPARWPICVRTFRRWLRNFHIDVLNTHGSLDSWTASIAARMINSRPLIIRTRHKSTAVTPNFRHELLYRYLPHAVWTTGERIRQDLISRNGLPETHVTSIPTGVNLEVFYPQPPAYSLKAQLGIRAECRVVGTVAFLRDYKGVEGMLSAAQMVVERCRDVHFVVVGDGPQKSFLEALAVSLGIHERVSFAGFREDVHNFLSFFDVVVLNSITGEGVPQVLTQALAMARPVVATNVGCIPEVIRHGETGLLVRPSHPQELAVAVTELLKHEGLRRKMGEAGRQFVVQHYSLEGMLNKIERLYGTLVS